jgi:hypothetical protein
MDVPKIYGGKPYQYEEGRVFSYNPVFVSNTTTQSATSPYNVAKYCIRGKICDLGFSCFFATKSGTPDANVTFTMPIYSTSMASSGYDTSAMLIAQSRLNTGANVSAFLQPEVSAAMPTSKIFLSATFADTQILKVSGSYEID